MEKNVGHPIDKVARVVLGVVLLSLVFLLEGSTRWFGLIGLVPIVTVVVGWCPGYAIFGLSTRQVATDKTEGP
ncbi:MAG: DUF2892 domain-containing protein [Candidatus Thiodiazotropha sp. (ex Monitilora ramsayi)]|nr:DUF2892 domain-containing protein [Candidatus Thiodiazotropha sp. (ex Monitilora ramsayi)]